MKKIIEVNNVSKHFGKNATVVSEVNFTVSEQEIVGIVGRNGSGKTVLLKIIAGLYRPSSGTVFVNGKNLNLTSGFPKDVGILIDTNFLSDMSGIKNLELLARLSKRATKKDCYSAMEKVGLDPFAKKKYGKYSTGMKQRLKLAQAILENPTILILDEPFNGIDEEGVLDFRRLLKELKKAGKTIIITSHNREDIEQLCDKTYEMSKGILKEKTIA